MQIINKLGSRKFLITLWAIIIITVIVIKNKSDFLNLANYLALIPLAYSGLNVWQKTKTNQL